MTISKKSPQKQIPTKMDKKHFDVIIIGGGLVGAFAAIGLSQNGLRVSMIDAQGEDAYRDLKIDGRTTAVAQGIIHAMRDFGVADEILKNGQPIDAIKVFEESSPWQVFFDHNDVGTDPLGYIVENYYIREAFYKRFESLDITRYYDTTVTHIEKSTSAVTVTLSNGDTLSAPLIVSAEGKHSPSRMKANVKTSSWDYGHMALVAHITHEKPHNNTAYEVFRPIGPLAVLPMADTEDGRHRSGLVWCDTIDTDWMARDLITLKQSFESIFPYLGAVEFDASKRWCFPLSAMKLDKTVGDRQVIIGDAAHVVHPIAGQGVNIGWRDVVDLVEVMKKAKSLGLDLGSPTLLNEYDRKRYWDQRGVLWATHGINKLFGNQSKTLFALRNAGFGLVNRIGPLKRLFMKKAMGI